VLYIDVAKVDRDVAHLVMAIHVCFFKCIFQMFYLFQTYVASILSRCCKIKSRCCIYMHVASICFKCFQVFYTYVCKCFYLDVAYVCNGFQLFFRCFRKCFRTFLSSVSFVFFCMFQLLHLDDSKVDRVLHMGFAWEAAGDAENVQGSARPLLVRSLVSPIR
jgi:hypothetical protein